MDFLREKGVRNLAISDVSPRRGDFGIFAEKGGRGFLREFLYRRNGPCKPPKGGANGMNCKGGFLAEGFKGRLKKKGEGNFFKKVYIYNLPVRS